LSRTSYAARATRFSIFVEDVAIQCLGVVSFGGGGGAFVFGGGFKEELRLRKES
jgi:hypothetical protein